MAGVNKCIILGRLGRDPEARTVGTGGKVVSFSVATSEDWTDKASGERKSKTQWHRVVIWNEHLAGVAERFLKKGSEVYLEGSIETRKFTDKDGAERETTEIVLSKFKGELALVGGRQEDRNGDERPAASAPRAAAKPAPDYMDDDDIDF